METVTEKTTVKNGGKQKDDPHIQLMKLRFWARFLISLLAFGLFGFLGIAMPYLFWVLKIACSTHNVALV